MGIVARQHSSSVDGHPRLASPYGYGADNAHYVK
jgi:hypothetical protein